MLKNVPPDILSAIFEFDRTKVEIMDRVLHQIRFIPVLTELLDFVHAFCSIHYISVQASSGILLSQIQEEFDRFYFKSNHYFGWAKHLLIHCKLFGSYDSDRYYFWKQYHKMKNKNDFYV